MLIYFHGELFNTKASLHYTRKGNLSLHHSSVEVRVLCHRGGREGKLSLIGQKCKMADGKQPSDWTIIQDSNSACDWTRIQDGEWKSSHLIRQ